MKRVSNKHESLALLGRALLASIFIVSGLSKIPAWDETVQYMSNQGIPLVPLFLFPAIFIEVMGGLSILLGFKARLGAAALILYLIPVTLILHGFWSLDGMDRQIQFVNFLKNLSIMGGLTIVMAFGAGEISIDAKRDRPKSAPPLRPVSADEDQKHVA